MKKLFSISLLIGCLIISQLSFAQTRRAPVNGTITIADVGATDRVQGPTLTVNACTFVAQTTNVGTVYFGGYQVTNASGALKGVALAAGASLSNISLDNINWAYFAADNAGDKIDYICN